MTLLFSHPQVNDAVKDCMVNWCQMVMGEAMLEKTKNVGRWKKAAKKAPVKKETAKKAPAKKKASK